MIQGQASKEVMQARIAMAKDLGIICCKVCDVPSGTPGIIMRKANEGYICQHCYEERKNGKPKRVES